MRLFILSSLQLGMITFLYKNLRKVGCWLKIPFHLNDIRHETQKVSIAAQPWFVSVKNKAPRCVSPRIGTHIMMVMREDMHRGISIFLP